MYKFQTQAMIELRFQTREGSILTPQAFMNKGVMRRCGVMASAEIISSFHPHFITLHWVHEKCR